MTEQEFLDAINSAKAFGYAEGMRASKPRELSDEEIIADAYRYRWLRDRHENTVIDIFSSRTWTSVEDYKKQLNDLIDAEIAKATPACLEMAEIKKASEK